MNYMIYPYSNSFRPILDIYNQIHSDKITSLAFPVSWEKKVEFISGYDMSSDFFSALDKVDGLIVPSLKESDGMFKDVINKIKKTIDMNKKVICCTELDDNYVEMIQKIDPNGLFVHIGKEEKFMYSLDNFQIQDCVVIAIGDMIRNFNTSNVICKLFNNFSQLGYRVAAITADKNCKLVGFKQFPNSVFKENSPEETKILKLNNYINHIQKEEQFDILIIQYPDGMIKHSDICGEGYGVRSFMLSQALAVDYFILNMPVEGIDGYGFSELNNTFKYRFGFEIDAVGFINKTIDTVATIEDERIIFRELNDADVNDYIESIDGIEGIHFLNLNNPLAIDEIANDCISKLSSNISSI